MQSEDQQQEQEHNHQIYQQADPVKVIWKALQNLKIGADN